MNEVLDVKLDALENKFFDTLMSMVCDEGGDGWAMVLCHDWLSLSRLFDYWLRENEREHWARTETDKLVHYTGYGQTNITFTNEYDEKPYGNIMKDYMHEIIIKWSR